MGEYVETAVGPIHEVELGGEGRVLLLVHGLGGSTTNWMAVADGLARHGRVVAIDLPGFGLSPPAHDYRLETHRLAVESYVEQHDEPVTLIGNSTGALLSEMVASHRPELVSRLILVAPATPPVYPDARLDWPTVTRLAVQATPVVGEAWGRRFIRSHTPQQLVRMSMQMITHKPGRVPLPLIEASVEMARVRKALPWSAEATARTASSIAAYYANRARFVRMVREIIAPTLVIQGVSDHIVSPSAVEWLCRLRPDWDLTQMLDTGHTPQMDAPLRFLSEVEPWLTKTDEAGSVPAGVGKAASN